MHAGFYFIMYMYAHIHFIMYMYTHTDMYMIKITLQIVAYTSHLFFLFLTKTETRDGSCRYLHYVCSSKSRYTSR